MVVRLLLSSVQALVCDRVLGLGVNGVGMNGAVDVGRMPPWVHTVLGPSSGFPGLRVSSSNDFISLSINYIDECIIG